MRVNDSNSSAVTGALKAQEAAASGQASKTGRQGGNSDRVQLSSLSAQLSDLQSDSPARLSYVEGLASMVASGSYVVDSRAVSSSILGYMTS
ncbi:MAG TPA: flagellar biosynthesis anti-sigma factor FlgM [Bryobacteraceae bacterium]|nr:flagellar biosynthesis anti-sigma factor FlgM [Bryobacteraceae bacterium]